MTTLKEMKNRDEQLAEKREHDIAVIMEDGSTRKEAEEHVDRGATVYSDEEMRTDFEELLNTWGGDNPEERAECAEWLHEMLESGKPAEDWGTAEYNGKRCWIAYVL